MRAPNAVGSVEQFIRNNLTLAPVPFVPEICLYKAHPASGLRRLADADAAFDSPYWAHYWSGGLALARYLLDHPELVAGRDVVDLGTGSGIVAIAARRAGAARVRAIDVDRYAIAAATLNAQANQVEVHTQSGDLTISGLDPATEILAIGDLFYEAATAARILSFAQREAERGAAVLIGDPGRAHLPLEMLEEVASYAVSEMTGAAKETGKRANVYRLRA